MEEEIYNNKDSDLHTSWICLFFTVPYRLVYKVSQTAVHDLRHGQDPEGQHSAVAFYEASGTEKKPVGRTPLEPILLRGDRQRQEPGYGQALYQHPEGEGIGDEDHIQL